MNVWMAILKYEYVWMAILKYEYVWMAILKYEYVWMAILKYEYKYKLESVIISQIKKYILGNFANDVEVGKKKYRTNLYI